MATTTEREALLAVSCPWCGVGPQTECMSQGRRLSSLDGGAHDARWRKALDQPAAVIRAAVAITRGDVEVEPPPPEVAAVPVGAVMADRPW